MRPFSLEHGVQIGQDLGGVFAPAVAAVDDRHGSPFGGFVRRALLEVAHHDHVAVEFQHFDRVFDRFLVEIAGAGHLGIRETGHVPTQAVHGGFVSQAGARAGLVKGRYQGLFLEQIAVAAVAGDRFKFFGNFEDTEELVALEIFER